MVRAQKQRQLTYTQLVPACMLLGGFPLCLPCCCTLLSMFTHMCECCTRACAESSNGVACSTHPQHTVLVNCACCMCPVHPSHPEHLSLHCVHVDCYMCRACRHLKATDPAKGPGLSVSVLVRHPTLGAYFDAHLLLQKCPEHQQCLPEQGGLASLLRYNRARLCCCMVCVRVFAIRLTHPLCMLVLAGQSCLLPWAAAAARTHYARYAKTNCMAGMHCCSARIGNACQLCTTLLCHPTSRHTLPACAPLLLGVVNHNTAHHTIMASCAAVAATAAGLALCLSVLHSGSTGRRCG
jgi:hypothetical protein